MDKILCNVRWTHAEFFLYVAVLLLLLYKPPQLAGLGGFIERHFGDSMGFYILHLGIALIMVGSVWANLSSVNEVGKNLVFAAMAVLKLTKPNGNGNGDGSAPRPVVPGQPVGA